MLLLAGSQMRRRRGTKNLFHAIHSWARAAASDLGDSLFFFFFFCLVVCCLPCFIKTQTAQHRCVLGGDASLPRATV